MTKPQNRKRLFFFLPRGSSGFFNIFFANAALFFRLKGLTVFYTERSSDYQKLCSPDIK